MRSSRNRWARIDPALIDSHLDRAAADRAASPGVRASTLRESASAVARVLLAGPVSAGTGGGVGGPSGGGGRTVLPVVALIGKGVPFAHCATCGVELPIAAADVGPNESLHCASHAAAVCHCREVATWIVKVRTSGDGGYALDQWAACDVHLADAARRLIARQGRPSAAWYVQLIGPAS